MADDYYQQQNGNTPQQPYQQPYQQQAYQQPYQQDYQQPYQQQPYQQQQYQQPYQQPMQQYQAPQPGAPAKSATTLIVLSVLEIIFLGGLFAIIPLVFAVQANSAYSVGDYVTGDAKAKTAKTALIVVAVVAVVLLVLVFGLAATGASMSS